MPEFKVPWKPMNTAPRTGEEIYCYSIPHQATYATWWIRSEKKFGGEQFQPFSAWAWPKEWDDVYEKIKRSQNNSNIRVPGPDFL